MSGKKNLVMGLFSRMTFDQLEKFLGSLRRTTFHGNVCAFVDEVTPETVATLVAHGVLIARAYPSARPELPAAVEPVLRLSRVSRLLRR